MIYRSNLTAPDLAPHFTLLVKPRPWSLGHSIPSDPDYEPENCFMSHDEAAILYHCALGLPLQSEWLDIGSRFGWTSKHINWASNARVLCIDQVYGRYVGKFAVRWQENTGFPYSWAIGQQSINALHELDGASFRGFCIDANHDAPEPTNDARGCLKIAAPDCCMVFHDFRGRPIRDAVRFLMSEGFKSRVYWTPAMMAVCWRGNFKPPVHVRDPAIDWATVRRAAEIDQDFDLSRCE